MIPLDVCSVCRKPYGFVNAKVTDLGTGVSHCLLCLKPVSPRN